MHGLYVSKYLYSVTDLLDSDMKTFMQLAFRAIPNIKL